MNSKDMREDFEKWAENQGFNIKTDGESYYFSDTHNVYMAWRACAELLQSRLESLEKDAARYRWLAAYLVSDRTDWDDQIVSSDTTEVLAETIDAALKVEA